MKGIIWIFQTGNENLGKTEQRIGNGFLVILVDVFNRIGRAFFRFGKFLPVVFGGADETHVR